MPEPPAQRVRHVGAGAARGAAQRHHARPHRLHDQSRQHDRQCHDAGDRPVDGRHDDDRTGGEADHARAVDQLFKWCAPFLDVVAYPAHRLAGAARRSQGGRPLRDQAQQIEPHQPGHARPQVAPQPLCADAEQPVRDSDHRQQHQNRDRGNGHRRVSGQPVVVHLGQVAGQQRHHVRSAPGEQVGQEQQRPAAHQPARKAHHAASIVVPWG